MSKKGSSGPDMMLLMLGVLVGIAFVGPALALQLKLSLTQIAFIMLPIVGPIMGVILVVLIIKMYWSRY